MEEIFSEPSYSFPELLVGFYLKDSKYSTDSIFLFILMLDHLEPSLWPTSSKCLGPHVMFCMLATFLVPSSSFLAFTFLILFSFFCFGPFFLHLTRLSPSL